MLTLRTSVDVLLDLHDFAGYHLIENHTTSLMRDRATDTHTDRQMHKKQMSNACELEARIKWRRICKPYWNEDVAGKACNALA